MSSIVSSFFRFLNIRALLWPKYAVTKKKAIVITGCDSGLGYSLSQKCSQIGLTVISGCLDLQSEGSKNLSSVNRVFKLDVTKPNTVATFFEEVDKVLKQENCGK